MSVCATTIALPLAAGVVPPLVVLVLCALAGIGTALWLPGPRERSLRRIGGVIVCVALLILAALVVRQAGVATAGDAYFWVFSAIAVFAALRVITHDRPVYSALYFVLTVVASAGLFVLMWAEFMAAALILIYAGAILVTYVFVIMLAQQAGSTGQTTDAIQSVARASCPCPDGITGQTTDAIQPDYDRNSRSPATACAVGFGLMAILLFVIFDRMGPLLSAKGGKTGATVSELATYLFSEQTVTFELAGVVLTLAVVGSIVIARRRLPPAAVLPERASAGTTPQGPDDNPHSIPVYGTENPTAKAYPER